MKKMLILIVLTCILVAGLYAAPEPVQLKASVDLQLQMHPFFTNLAPGVNSFLGNQKLTINVPLGSGFAAGGSMIIYNTLFWALAWPAVEEYSLWVKKGFPEKGSRWRLGAQAGSVWVRNNVTDTAGLAVIAAFLTRFQAATWIAVYPSAHLTFYQNGFQSEGVLILQPRVPGWGWLFDIGCRTNYQIDYTFTRSSFDILFILGVGYEF